MEFVVKKNLVLFFLILFSINYSAFAENRVWVNNARSVNDPNARYNSITIYNNSGKDIAYVMMGVFGGAIYGIPSGEVDIYHSGDGDTFATFQVGICHGIHHDLFGWNCDSFELISNCSSQHYNAELIKSIYIKSANPNSCSITCSDGGTNSCKQSG
jgi:hypothetical protein